MLELQNTKRTPYKKRMEAKQSDCRGPMLCLSCNQVVRESSDEAWYTDWFTMNVSNVPDSATGLSYGADGLY